MINTTLARQAPPGLSFRAPAAPVSLPPVDQFTSSSESGRDDDASSRLIFAGVGLAVAAGAAGGAIWLTNNVTVPDAPPIQIEAPKVNTPERVRPEPIVRRETTPYTPRYSAPRTETPRQRTQIDSNGTITVPLGNGVSIDTEGRTSVQIGDTTLRSDGRADFKLNDNTSIRTDGTIGFKLNDNMTLRSDGTVEYNFGFGR